MVENEVISISVSVEGREGWHMATSQDLPGLVLAHQDRDTVMRDLPKAISLLYSARHNCECHPHDESKNRKMERLPFSQVPNPLSFHFGVTSK